MDEAPRDAANASERRALRFLAWTAIAVVAWIAHPLGVGLFLGALLAFTLQPIERRLRARGAGASAAAAICVSAAMSAIVIALGAFGASFAGRAVQLSEQIPTLLDPDGELGQLVERCVRAVHLDPHAAIVQLRDQAATIGARAAGMAADVAGFTLDALLALFFMGLAAYYVLRHWQDIVRHAERVLPFAPAHTRGFMGELRTIGRSVLRGTVLTGLLQGVLACVGLWIAGVPDAAFYGALTCAASLVPAVGTLVVWVPAGIWLVTTGHVGMGIGLLVYGALVIVGVVDYFVRPALVGREGELPAVLTFIGLFGGLEVFGVLGLILGPVLVALCIAVLRTYEAEARSDVTDSA